MFRNIGCYVCLLMRLLHINYRACFSTYYTESEYRPSVYDTTYSISKTTPGAIPLFLQKHPHHIYNLRPCVHKFILSAKHSAVTVANFSTRMLFHYVYLHCFFILLKSKQQEITCLLSQLLSKITVTSCSFFIKCSVCQLCCWTTHSQNVLLQKVVLFSLVAFIRH